MGIGVGVGVGMGMEERGTTGESARGESAGGVGCALSVSVAVSLWLSEVLMLDVRSVFEHEVRELLVVCESVAGMGAGVVKGVGMSGVVVEESGVGEVEDSGGEVLVESSGTGVESAVVEGAEASGIGEAGVGVGVGVESSGAGVESTVVEGSEVEVASVGMLGFVGVAGGVNRGVMVEVDAGADVDVGVVVAVAEVSCSGIGEREGLEVGTLLAELLRDEGGEEKSVFISSARKKIKKKKKK